MRALLVLFAAGAVATAEPLWLAGCEPDQPVAGRVTLELGAGQGPVAYALLLLDGRPVAISGALPLSFEWDTCGESAGAHRLQAFVWREAGGTAEEAEWWLTVRPTEEPLRQPGEALEADVRVSVEPMSASAGRRAGREAFGPLPRLTRAVEAVAPWLDPPAADPATVTAPAPRDTPVAACGLVIQTRHKVTVSAGAMFRDGRVYAAARELCESLGGRVEWRDGRLTARLAGRLVVVVPGAATATVNGTNVTLPAPAVLEDGRVWAPARCAERWFGAKVQWDPVAKTATVSLEPGS